MKPNLCAAVLSSVALVASAIAAEPEHQLFSQVLAAHVKAGRVDYHGLRADPRLPRYLEQLAATDPDRLASDQDRLALWLNAYNAYTLQLIVDRQPAKSITEIGSGGLVLGSLLKTTAWDIPYATVGGRKYTLNQIEHEVIRAQFQDARTHFALNCASGSCPILPTAAFEASSLDEQLEEQGRLFLRDSTRNRFDLATKTAHLSRIFKWYRKDFGATDRDALLNAAQYAAPDVRAAITADPNAWTVRYLAYDWTLNSLEKPAAP